MDLTYDSYFEVRMFSDDHLHDRWTERVGLKLEESFYPKGGKVRVPVNGKNCSGCCCKEKGLNFDIVNNVLNISVRQVTNVNLANEKHDGHMYERHWFYTANRTLDFEENERFIDNVTVTTFVVSYSGDERKF